MKGKVDVAVIGGESANISCVEVVIDKQFTPCNIPYPEVYEIKVSPMIDMSCLYMGKDKHKNHPWKRRGKNIKC